MKKLVFSLMTVFFVVALTAGATYAVFSSSAAVTGNTFSTGVLDIRVNTQPAVAGFNFTNAAPGSCTVETQKTVNNYGAPWFAGPSTLDAKELVMKVANKTGDMDLYNALEITVEANRGWPTRMPVYSGKLKNMGEADLLDGRWSDLAPGNSEDVWYTVCLPETAGNALQGKSATWDFIFTGYNPHR